MQMIVRPRFAVLALALAAFPLARAHAQEPVVSPGSPGGTDRLSLRPGDILRISIWPDNSFGGEFAVEETGLVYLPFLGALQVVGMPLDRLRSELRRGYGEIMKEPVVTITPLFTVNVMGGVRRPGIYRITPSEDLLDVILMAGGFAERAKEDQVQLVREGQVLKYNVERALQEAADISALTLRSGDKIVVPLGGRFTFRDFTAIFSFATTTTLLIVNLVDSGSGSSSN